MSMLYITTLGLIAACACLVLQACAQSPEQPDLATGKDLAPLEDLRAHQGKHALKVRSCANHGAS
jgi:hypothetical protein